MSRDLMTDALAVLGLRLGDPLTIDGHELVPATCLACRRSAWAWPGGIVSDGRAMLLDLEFHEGQSYLSLHGCHFEPGPWEIPDPDWADWP